MNVISRFLIGGTMAGALLTGCSEPKNDKFDAYMENKPYAETLEIKSKLRDGVREVDTQRYLDSIAYRDILKSTDAINNSKIVADFNKIAAYTKADVESKLVNTGLTVTHQNEVNKNSLLKKLIDLNVSAKEYKAMEKLNTKQLQFAVDSVAYNQFFKKHKLTGSIDVSRQLKNICKKIRP